jgi:hypothetical protein
MTTLTLDSLLLGTDPFTSAGVAERDAAASDGEPSFSTVTGGGLTLDDLISSVWEGLAAGEPVECPGCGSAMRPRAGCAGTPPGGICTSCGSRLS